MIRKYMYGSSITLESNSHIGKFTFFVIRSKYKNNIYNLIYFPFVRDL